MCGIAGLAGPAPDRQTLLRAMAAAIEHRGPDEGGEFIDDGAALAIRRLSIIDVPGGHQPYSNETGSIRVVFNGEIYGYRCVQAARPLEKAADHRCARPPSSS
jgi:asparagine synthase (glutamine-hydrolysing)